MQTIGRDLASLGSRFLREIYSYTPEGLQRAVLLRRRQSIWLRAGIVFIHIPRAAGASISEALYGCFMGHVHASDVRRWGSPALNALPLFAVTRNPWDRLVSAYRFARRGRGVGGKLQASVRRPGQYQTPQFASFGRFVTEWLADRDLTVVDPIFQPQWPFVCNAAGEPLVDHLGQVENLEPTLDFIRKSIGAPVCIERSNRSGESTDYREFYTAELVKLVRGIYQRDVELFGYEF